MWNQETSINEDFIRGRRGWETSTGAPACLMSSLVVVASGAWLGGVAAKTGGKEEFNVSKPQE